MFRPITLFPPALGRIVRRSDEGTYHLVIIYGANNTLSAVCAPTPYSSARVPKSLPVGRNCASDGLGQPTKSACRRPRW